MSTRVAFVTGAGRGIGRAIALRLGATGFAVAVTDLDEHQAVAVAAEITVAGGQAAPYRADVADLDVMRNGVARVVERFGAIHALVNNAGWDRMEPFLENDPALWDRLIAINFKGVLNTTRAVLDVMTAQGGGGRIVSIASDAGRVGSTGEAVYAGCKAGVIGFSKSIAREVARHGITVNCVCPGPTDTALLAEVGSTERGAKIVAGMQRAIPLRRLGQPDDVAGAVAYFLSDEAAFVTGQTLSVSGGLTMAG